MEAILKTQEELQALFMQKMDAFQTELQQSSSTNGTGSLSEQFTAFRSYILLAMKSMQHQIVLLARDVDNLEMRARRKILLFHGVADVKDEDTVACAVRVINDLLKIPDFSASDISRSHRMGRSSASDKPRPILVKIRDLAKRQQVWYAKSALKESGITVSEFLTKTRHDAFMAARERFGINRCWTRDGYVVVREPDGKRHRISSLAELNGIRTPAQTPDPTLTHSSIQSPGSAQSKKVAAAVETKKLPARSARVAAKAFKTK